MESPENAPVSILSLAKISVPLAKHRRRHPPYSRSRLSIAVSTKDLSYGLKTSFSVAQELKEKHGLSSLDHLVSDDPIDFVAVDGRTQRQVGRRELVEIIQSRVEEVFELLHQELQKSNYSDVIPGGIVLTGGCSLLDGIDKTAEKVFGMTVHRGHPIQVEGPAEILNNPVYATAIGLLKYHHVGEWGRSHRSLRSPSLVRKVRNWLDEVF